MLQHLDSPEYLHVLLNPLPVYGLATGVLGLLIGLIFRARAARATALILIFVAAMSAWPVYHYGEAGYDRVKSMAETDGGKWLDEHQRRGEQLILVFYIVAGLAAVGVVVELKLPRSAVPLSIAALILALAALGIGGYIAYAGGHVRHREFRFEPPPEEHEEAEHTLEKGKQ